LGGDLEIPEQLNALHLVLLKARTRLDLANFQHITLNVLGFIPFGALPLAIAKNAVGSLRHWVFR
jgi:hypothetical protein